jgi:spore coat polysaccharide biosynthesis protein SpsF
MANKSFAFIQARMGSKRLPNKMVENLGPFLILDWVIYRVKKAKLIDKVVLLTTENIEDDRLVEIARAHNVEFFRGAENDVLSRFVQAASLFQSDSVVRICADNPFIDHNEIDRLIATFYIESCEYACNHQDRLGNLYADGFGAEILTAKLLHEIGGKVMPAHHREHVTSFLWENFSDYRMLAIPAPSALAFPELRFDLDSISDLERLRAIVCSGITIDSCAPEIIKRYIDILKNKN